MHTYQGPDDGVSRGAVPEEGLYSVLNITAATLIVARPGRVARINVVVAGSAAGSVNDSATVAGAGAANQIAATPNSLGPIQLNFPFTNGLVITPGTGQTLSVAYS